MSGTFNHLLVAQEALNAFMDTDVDPELRICDSHYCAIVGLMSFRKFSR